MSAWNHHRTRELIRSLAERMELQMSENAARIDTALEGIAGDVAGLNAKYEALVEAQAAGEAAAVEAARVEFESSLDALASKAEALDAETPPVEPPPVEEPPVEPAP